MDTELLVQETLGRIADKWTLLVLEELHEGELRFSQISQRIPGISQKMLTKTLRLLERDGLVTRFVHATVPPRVDYNLTPLGQSLAQAVCAIWMWAEKHVHDVQAARERYEKLTASSSSSSASTKK